MGVYDSTEFSETLPDGLGVAPVHGLLRILLQPRLDLLPKRRIQAAHVLPLLLKEGLVDKLVARIPGNVAADDLAVHPNGLARDLELGGLEARQSAEAGLHQVLARGVRIVVDAAAKQIVGVQRRGLVLHPDKAEKPNPSLRMLIATSWRMDAVGAPMLPSLNNGRKTDSSILDLTST